MNNTNANPANRNNTNQNRSNRSGGRNQAPQSEFDEKVVEIKRVTKKTKGGNHITFTCLVVVGDRAGKVGVAIGKATDVLSAIKKSVARARKRMVSVPRRKGTIPFAYHMKFGAAQVLLKPAPAGTGVIAGGAVRSVVEAAGIENIVCKIMGSSNKMNNVWATFEALKEISSLVKVKKITLDEPKKTTPSAPKTSQVPAQQPQKHPSAPQKQVTASKPSAKKPVSKKPTAAAKPITKKTSNQKAG